MSFLFLRVVTEKIGACCTTAQLARFEQGFAVGKAMGTCT
jgi:hypothetical protein